MPNSHTARRNRWPGYPVVPRPSRKAADDTTWNDTTWNDTTWNDTTWNDTTWNDTTWNDTTEDDTTWNDTTWNDTTWNDTTWNDTTEDDTTGDGATGDGATEVGAIGGGTIGGGTTGGCATGGCATGGGTTRAGTVEDGMVTAETAILLPALAVVLAGLVWVIATVMGEVRCIDAAREAARLAARGDAPAQVVSVARQIAPAGAGVSIARQDGEIIATVIARQAPGGWARRLGTLPLHATATATDETASAGSGGTP
jgi:TadE-like protein